MRKYNNYFYYEVSNFVYFHFVKAPGEILRLWRNFLLFFYHFFSIGLLLSTFFSPWKKIYLVKTTSGFSFSEWGNRLAFNLISRSLGALFRLTVILAGVLMELAVLILGTLGFLGWFLALPLSLLVFYYEVSNSVYCQKKGPDLKKKEKRQEAFLRKRLGENLAAASLEDKEEVSRWFEREEAKREKASRFWELENLLALPGLAKTWAAGYTLELDCHTFDLAAPRPYSSHLVGRTKEAAAIERVLSGATLSSCILAGEPGVGRQTMVENFAKRSREGRTIPSLEQKRVLLLNLEEILGEAKSRSGAEAKILEILEEAGRAGDVILVLRDFDRFTSDLEGRLNLTGVFARAIEETGLRFIGITTPADFQKFIFPNRKLLRYFSKIEVDEPTGEEALEILENVLPLFERNSGVQVAFPVLKEIAVKSQGWQLDVPFPERALELLDEALVFVRDSLGKKVLVLADLRKFLAEKTEIPQGLTADEEKILINLEEILHKKIIDQEEALAEIAKALRRRRTGVAPAGRPLGAFLFLGPTGVGKTQTAKALAEVLFGSQDKLLRLDMATFQGEDAEERLLGSFERKEPGVLVSAVRENPYAVLLLDELEKASVRVQNLFLTAIDEGYLTDVFGKKVSFENLLIIGTSNAGAEFIRQKLTDPPCGEAGTPDVPDIPDLSAQLIDFVLRQGFFSPEFLNRFDAVVVFRPLGQKELAAIARLKLDQLNERLAEKKVSLEITPKLLGKLAVLGFDPVFGARPMERVIADKVEDVIAKKLLAGEVREGEKIKIEI